jgi:hypothetical protein
MSTTSELWSKLHKAQAAKNTDAANAYREAIIRIDKGKEQDAIWWEIQGDDAMGGEPTSTKETREHVTR